MDVEVPFFWAISDQTDATFYQRYMSKRGYMQGLEFRYLADEDSKGIFMFDILSDREDKKNMNDPDEVALSPFGRKNSTRYWFRSKVDQDLPFGLVARLDGDFVSDQDYLKEFENGLFGFEVRPNIAEEFGRPFEEQRSPTRRSAFRLSRDAENYSLQAGSSYNQRAEHPDPNETPQPLGSLNFILLPEKLMNLPIYFNLESDYDYVWRDEGEKGHRISISPELRFPLWLFDRYLEFEPRIRYLLNSQWIDDSAEKENHLSKGAYEVGARLAASAERIYNLGWMNATKLKHKISPVLSYAYEVRHDDEGQSPWFEPIENNVGIDEIGNQISLSLANFFDARFENKKGQVTYRQWATFTLSQAYNISEARRNENPQIEKKPFAPLTASLSAYPTSHLDLRWTTAWDHYEKEISYTMLSLDLLVDRSGGREDHYSIDYMNYQTGQRSLNYWVEVNLAYGFSVGSSLQRDLDLGENISNSYWLQYKSQCWGVKLAGEIEDGDTSIMLQFHLLGLGDFRAF
jgi:LPS-assembly protein